MHSALGLIVGLRVQSRLGAQVGQPSHNWQLPSFDDGSKDRNSDEEKMGAAITELAFRNVTGIKSYHSPTTFTGYGTFVMFSKVIATMVIRPLMTAQILLDLRSFDDGESCTLELLIALCPRRCSIDIFVDLQPVG